MWTCADRDFQPPVVLDASPRVQMFKRPNGEWLWKTFPSTERLFVLFQDTQTKIRIHGSRKKGVIVQSDIVASNGMIHVIDKLMDSVSPTVESDTQVKTHQHVFMCNLFRGTMDEYNVTFCHVLQMMHSFIYLIIWTTCTFPHRRIWWRSFLTTENLTSSNFY